MSDENLKAGKVVQLKSGGPIMTISWVDGASAYCEWFDGNKNLGASFPLVSLKSSS